VYNIKAVELAKKHNDDHTLGYATKNLSMTYMAQREYLKSLETQKEALAIAKKINDYDLMALCYNNIGYISHNIYQLETGLNYLYKGLALCEEKPIKDKNAKGLILGNIAYCYTLLNDHDTALQFLQQIMEYSDLINNQDLKVRFCDELALSLLANDLTEEAHDYCEKCIKLSKESGFIMAELNASLAMAEINVKEENFKSALSYTDRGLALGEKLSIFFIKPKINLLKSKVLHKQGETDNAIKKALDAYNFSKIPRPQLAADITHQLSLLYVGKKDFENAYKFEKEHLKWTKSEQEQKVFYQAAELEAKYQNENQHKRIQLLNKEKELVAKTSLVYQLGLFLLSLALLVGIFLFLAKRKTVNKLGKLNRELIKTKLALESKQVDLEKYIESNIQLEQFAHVASHDLKAPINTIKSFSDLLKKKTKQKLSDEEHLYMNFIQSNANQTLELISDLLEYSKINSQKLKLETIDMNDLILSTCALLNYNIDDKNIILNPILPRIKLKGDQVKLKRVIQNLISNAIKFTDSKKANEIKITAKENFQYWEFSISDTGIGMKDSKTDIFKPYKQLNSKDEYEGTGMGLSICKKIIEQHGGNISYKSEFGVGSTFQFSIAKDLTPTREIGSDLLSKNHYN